jgi:Fic family protein
MVTGSKETLDGVDWGKLEEVHRKMKMVRPKDSFTIDEYAKRYDLSKSGATKRLRKLVEKGVLNKYHRNGMKAYFTLAE